MVLLSSPARSCRPLKGGKASNYQGGVRVNSFVAGGFVPSAQRGKKLEGLVGIWDVRRPSVCRPLSHGFRRRQPELQVLRSAWQLTRRSCAVLCYALSGTAPSPNSAVSQTSLTIERRRLGYRPWTASICGPMSAGRSRPRRERWCTWARARRLTMAGCAHVPGHSPIIRSLVCVQLSDRLVCTVYRHRATNSAGSVLSRTPKPANLVAPRRPFKA